MNKVIVGLAALALTFGQPAYAAVTSVNSLETPTVEIRENEACQEVTYTYMVGVTSDKKESIEALAFEVRSADDAVVASSEASGAFSLSGAEFATEGAAVDMPCAHEARYGIYGDTFDVEPGTVEDFQIRVFFSPEVAGAYHAILTGLKVREAGTAGGGICRNCIKVTENDTGGGVVLANTVPLPPLQMLPITPSSTEDGEIADITAFINFLFALGILK